MGLDVPTRELRHRRSSERFCFSRSSMASTSGSQGLSAIASQQACRSGGQGVGRDNDLVMGGVGNREGCGRRDAALRAAAVGGLPHSADVDGVVLKGLGERLFELDGARPSSRSSSRAVVAPRLPPFVRDQGSTGVCHSSG